MRTRDCKECCNYFRDYNGKEYCMYDEDVYIEEVEKCPDEEEQ